MSKLLEILANASVRSAYARGRTVTIQFGTDDVRDLSAGVLPAIVVRCNRMGDGSVEETRHGAPTASRREVNKRTRAAGVGSRSGAVEQWVEVRPFVPDEHVIALQRNHGAGPKWLGAVCKCGWRGGSPGDRQRDLEAAGREHVATAGRSA